MFAQDDTVTLDGDQTRTIPDSKKTERSSEKHVTMDVTHRAEKYENRKGKETTINSDQKKLRGYSEQRGNKSAHRRNSSETKNSKYLRKENQSPSKGNLSTLNRGNCQNTKTPIQPNRKSLTNIERMGKFVTGKVTVNGRKTLNFIAKHLEMKIT